MTPYPMCGGRRAAGAAGPPLGEGPQRSVRGPHGLPALHGDSQYNKHYVIYNNQYVYTGVYNMKTDNNKIYIYIYVHILESPPRFVRLKFHSGQYVHRIRWYIVYTVCNVYIVYIVYNVESVYIVYNVYNVYTAYIGYVVNIISFTTHLQARAHAMKLGQADSKICSTSFSYLINPWAQYEINRNTHMPFEY